MNAKEQERTAGAESSTLATPTILRTPREWTEHCDKCHGSGSVHKRQHFALATPDEYAGTIQPLDAKHEAPNDAYTVVAMNSTIFEACEEALEIARIVKRPVVFVFNGAMAIVREFDDPFTQAKRWWKKAYGRTYEEDARDR